MAVGTQCYQPENMYYQKDVNTAFFFVLKKLLFTLDWIRDESQAIKSLFYVSLSLWLFLLLTVPTIYCPVSLTATLMLGPDIQKTRGTINLSYAFFCKQPRLDW